MANTPTETLHRAGQSLWLDYITRELVRSGTLARYIDDLSVTGLTSNPSIFDKAFEGSADYDDAIRAGASAGRGDEDLFFDIAIEDIRAAADLLRPVWERTDGVDGWASLEVSPRLAFDTEATSDAAQRLHAAVDRPNVFIKIPGTPEGLGAIEESIARGIPVNVTLLFSAEQYTAQAQAYLRGIERRVAAGENPAVASVASIFVSRWDKKVPADAPAHLKDRLGVTVSQAVYRLYRDLYASDRWSRLVSMGARPQRLLWASTSTKDPALPDTFYIGALASPGTVNTMPEGTLLAFADHGEVEAMLPRDGGDADAVLADFRAVGIDQTEVGQVLQKEGAAAFVDSWESLMGVLQAKTATLGAAS